MQTDEKQARGWLGYLWRTVRDAQGRRPLSFYLLLAIPLVMLLGLHLLLDRSDPKRMALGLTLFVVFFGVLMLRAIMDIFDIGRRRLREQRTSFRETIGETAFTEELGRRVREERGPHDAADESDWLNGG